CQVYDSSGKMLV
nr:immunoglobulin light chain junction region [Macaca mulatta]